MRLPRSVVREIEELAREKGASRSAIIRELFVVSLREVKLRRALELVREGKVSVWRGG